MSSADIPGWERITAVQQAPVQKEDSKEGDKFDEKEKLEIEKKKVAIMEEGKTEDIDKMTNETEEVTLSEEIMTNDSLPVPSIKQSNKTLSRWRCVNLTKEGAAYSINVI